MISYGDQEQPDAMAELKYPYRFYPLLINVTPEIEDLLKSNEAKAYMKEVAVASQKLVALFERECKGNAAEFLPRVMKEPHTATRIRHEVLHRCFDELFACFITENPEKMKFLDTPLHDFMEWSHQMTIEATCEHQD